GSWADILRRRSCRTRLGEGRAALGGEADALGQRQVIAIVDCVGGAPHIGAPAVRAALAAAAGLLLAAKGPADLRTRGSDVDIGYAAVGSAGRQEMLGFLQ